MNRVNLTITLTLRGPVLSQSSTPGAYGLDAAMARRSSDNRPYLPGTLVLGRLRQAWAELSEATDAGFISGKEIDDLLGKLSGNRKETAASVDPNRKRLQASDFLSAADVAAKEGAGTERSDTLFRIRMKKERGTVETGAYLVIDSPFAPGSQVQFTGTISFLAAEGEHDDLCRKIETGLRWVTSFGAERSVGFGQLLDIKVEKKIATPLPAAGFDSPADCFRLIVRPRDPFCIARRQIDENLYESEEVIPGGVLKGGLASTWGMLLGKGPNESVDPEFDPARRELGAAFAQLRFSHAFPVEKNAGRRPVHSPLSLVKAGKLNRVVDVATWAEPKLIDGEAPRFAVDWKDASDVRKRFHWPNLDRELRVRTAMDRSSRKSRDQQLFAYEMVVPDGHHWEAMVDLSRVEVDRGQVLRQLAEVLCHGLAGWGKTKAFAATEIAPVTPFAPVAPRDGHYFITLQTPAILCDPQNLNEGSGSEDLHQAYAAAWSELSDGNLELVRFFAQQSLAGGYYLHRRFQSSKSYYPWLLTDPGSIFVLKEKSGSSPDAAEKVANWRRQGLPIPAWARERYGRNGAQDGDHWQNCPFIPENGYGEIAVNLDLNDFPAEAANHE